MDFLISDYQIGSHYMQRGNSSKGRDKIDSFSLQAEVYADLGCSKMLG